METRTIETRSALNQALPETFDFYHLGKVEPSATQNDLEGFTDYDAIAFRLFGDVRGLFLVLFEKGLDVSLYTEMGNLIAARLVTRLNQQSALDVMITAPEALSESSLHRLLDATKPLAARTYLHVYGKEVVLVRTLIFAPGPTENEESGNA